MSIYKYEKKESEKATEKYLCHLVKTKLQGIPYKFTSPNRRSVPDRLLILPNGGIVFVEVKSSDGILTIGQKRELKRLQMLGHKAYVVYNKAQVASLIDKILEGKL